MSSTGFRGAPAAAGAGAAVETRGLSKTYPSARQRSSGGAESGRAAAVRDLTLSVQPGELFGFLGANGAGKTTTLKMLLGFHAPTGGTASLFGVPIAESAARRGLGYLPEQPYFPRFLTAGETVRMHARLAGLGRADAKRSIACLDRVGLGAHEKTPLARLSKGMTQRVGLAAALVADPRLLLLDEPASGLDPLARRDMIVLLRELSTEGRTVFLSSHFLAEVEDLCHRVAILRQGVLVAQGAPGEIARRDAGWTAVTARDVAVERAARIASEFGGSVQPATDGSGAALRLRIPSRWVYAVLSQLERGRATLVAVAPARETLEAAFFRLVEGSADDPAHPQGAAAAAAAPAPSRKAA